MVRRLTFRAWLLALTLSCAGAAHAERLTVASLIELKSLGFGEAEIREQVARSGESVELAEGDAERLEAAGFSTDFLAFLRTPPAPPPMEPARGVGDERLPPPRAQPPPVAPEVRPREAEPPPSPPPAAPAYPRDLVLEIQRHLNRLGYGAGGEDGVMGRQTMQAIRRFQQDAGLVADGVPSGALLERLRQESQQYEERPAPPGPDAHGALAGAWQASYQGGYGYPTQMQLVLSDDGTFTSASSSAMGYAEAYGNYAVQGDVLTLENQFGQVQSYRFRLVGDQLLVQMPPIPEEIVFSRYPMQ
jgi:hypothetical protein